MSDTWNAIGTTFNAILMNASDGAGGSPIGAAASRLLNLQSNGVTIFSVDVANGPLTPNAKYYSGQLSNGNIRNILGIDASNNVNVGGVNGSLTLNLWSGAANTWQLTTAGILTGVTANSNISTNEAAALLRTVTALTDAVGASAGTLTNAPSVGNPTKWIQINDAGTVRKIPTWT